MKRIFFLILVLIGFTSCIAQYKKTGNNYNNNDGTLQTYFRIGKTGGGFKWDKDSLAYKLFWYDNSNKLDSAWISISNALSSPWAINIEARQRQDADNNLQSQINLLANVSNYDSLLQELDIAKAQILLKANKTYVDSNTTILQGLISSKASVLTIDTLKLKDNIFENRIQSAESNLLLKANKTTTDSLGNKITSLQSLVALKANISTTDSLKISNTFLNTRLTNAESSLQLKANKTTTDSLGLQFSLLQSGFNLKANVSYVDSLSEMFTDTTALLRNRLSTAEAGIQANASLVLNALGEISDIQSNLLLYAKKDSIISYINISPETIKISANKILLSGTTIADSLFGKTIIAPYIKTSASGKRIEINSTTNTIDFFDDTGSLIGKLDGTTSGGNSYLNSTSNIYTPALYTNYLSVTSGVYQNIISNGSLFFIKQGAGTPAQLSFDWTSRRLSLDGYLIPNFLDLSWDNISNKPTTFAPSSHTHIVSDITGFYGAIEDYLVNNFDAASKNWVVSQLTWSNITNKPTEFNPAPHTHINYEIAYNRSIISMGLSDYTLQITKQDNSILQVDLSPLSNWANITNKPNTLAGYGIVNGVSTSSTYHDPSWLASLNWSKISSKPTSLAGFGISDGVTITDFNSALATKITNPLNAYGFLANDGFGNISWGGSAQLQTMWENTIGTDYYTKTNLQTSGQAQVHFNNLTNKPTTLSGYGITDGATINDNTTSTSSTWSSNKISGMNYLTKPTADTYYQPIFPTTSYSGAVWYWNGSSQLWLQATSLPTASTIVLRSGSNEIKAGTFIGDTFVGYLNGTADNSYNASYVPWSGVTGKPSTFTPSPHTHADADLMNIDWSKILNKPATTNWDVAYNRSIVGVSLSDYTLQMTKQDNSILQVNLGYLSNWNNITNKPSAFTPSAHTHTHSDITDFYSAMYDYLVNSFDAATKSWVNGQGFLKTQNWNASVVNSIGNGLGIVSGTLYVKASNGLGFSGGDIVIDYTGGQSASSTTKGFLTPTDWNTFNNKANASHTHSYNDITGGFTGTVQIPDSGSNVHKLTFSHGVLISYELL